MIIEMLQAQFLLNFSSDRFTNRWKIYPSNTLHFHLFCGPACYYPL